MQSQALCSCSSASVAGKLNQAWGTSTGQLCWLHYTTVGWAQSSMSESVMYIHSATSRSSTSSNERPHEQAEQHHQLNSNKSYSGIWWHFSPMRNGLQQWIVDTVNAFFPLRNVTMRQSSYSGVEFWKCLCLIINFLLAFASACTEPVPFLFDSCFKENFSCCRLCHGLIAFLTWKKTKC